MSHEQVEAMTSIPSSLGDGTGCGGQDWGANLVGDVNEGMGAGIGLGYMAGNGPHKANGAS